MNTKLKALILAAALSPALAQGGDFTIATCQGHYASFSDSGSYRQSENFIHGHVNTAGTDENGTRYHLISTVTINLKTGKSFFQLKVLGTSDKLVVTQIIQNNTTTYYHVTCADPESVWNQDRQP